MSNRKGVLAVFIVVMVMAVIAGCSGNARDIKGSEEIQAQQGEGWNELAWKTRKKQAMEAAA